MSPLSRASRRLMATGAFLLCLGATSVAHADTFVVTNTNNSGAGSLRTAITAANSNRNGEDVITFAANVTGAINITSLSDGVKGGNAFTLSESVRIVGPGAGNLTVQRSAAAGTPNMRLFTIAEGITANISGLTISGGTFSASYEGGAINNEGTLTLQDCTVSNSSTQGWGGGISNIGTLTLQGSTIANNSANGSNGPINGRGGGLFNDGTLTLQSSIVTGNGAIINGGGIFCYGGTVLVQNSSVNSNNAAGLGGGLANEGGTITVRNSTVASNTATTGGGGLFVGNGATIDRSTISGNTAGGATRSTAGGIECNAATTITDSTISGNSVTAGNNNGGGLWSIGNISISACTITGNSASGAASASGIYRAFNPAILGGSIVAGNINNSSQPDIVGLIGSNGFNLIGNPGTSSGFIQTDQRGTAATPLNPLLGALANNGGPTLTHLPLAGSPAINQGLDTGTDQRGALRPPIPNNRTNPAVDAPDAGSVETAGDPAQVGPNFTVTTTDEHDDSVCGVSDCSLREAINAANSNGNPLIEDVISFAPGVTGTITIEAPPLDGPSAYTLSEQVRIVGPGASALTIQRSTGLRINDFRLFLVNSGVSATLSGLSLRNGRQNAGGAIYNSGGTLALRNCLLEGNFATSFGGAVMSDGVLTMQNCTVRGNTATVRGGGLFVTNSTSTLVSSIQNSTISGNTCNGTSCSGGIDSFISLAISNSTISGNRAPSGNNNGGGLRLNTQGSSTIINCTITGNSAAGASSGSGVFNGAGTVTVSNTIVAGNTNNTVQPDVAGAFTSSNNNLIGNVGTATGLTGVGNQTGNATTPLNPVLGPLADNGGFTQTHALLVGSPAIDAGRNALLAADTLDVDGDGNTTETLPTDQRGVGSPRIVNFTVDIGAYEYLPTVATSGIAISEFRTSGPGGSADEYVELANNTTELLNVGNWTVRFTSSVGTVSITIPAATTIPAGGHYLLTGSGYGLTAYAGSDQALTGDIIQDTTVSLYNAAGTLADDTSGATTATTTLTGQYAWVRPSVGDPSFSLVSVDATSGTQLGTPGPQNLSSPIPTSNNGITYALVYPPAGDGAAPNRSRSTSAASKASVTAATGEATNQGIMQLRRAITNNTERSITGFRVRVVNITNLNSPGYSDSAQADLRLMSSSDQNILFTVGGTPQLVRGTTVQTAPTQTRGAGLNSSMSMPSVTLAQPLGPGQTVNYNFMYGVIRDGRFNVTFYFEPIYATP